MVNWVDAVLVAACLVFLFLVKRRADRLARVLLEVLGKIVDAAKSEADIEKGKSECRGYAEASRNIAWAEARESKDQLSKLSREFKNATDRSAAAVFEQAERIRQLNIELQSAKDACSEWAEDYAKLDRIKSKAAKPPEATVGIGALAK